MPSPHKETKRQPSHSPVDLLQGHVRPADDVEDDAARLGNGEPEQGAGDGAEGGVGGAALALAVADAHQSRACG